jgi:hypothetical protein
MRFLIFLILVLSAGTLRFYRLDTWSFGFDELFTTLETKILFGETPVPDEYLHGGTVKPEETQYYRLPRLLCASYGVHRLDYLLFGEDEFGSRVLMAVLGSLSVGVIFLLAQPLIGNTSALILALLIMLLPEHIQNSQCNRFYIQSFFLISAVLLLGNYVTVNRSCVAAFWLGPLAVLMVLSNSFGGIIWAGLLGGFAADLLCSKNFGKAVNKSNGTNSSGHLLPVILLLTVWSVLLLGIFVFHIVPLAASWNGSSAWGYTPFHAVMAFVNIFGWTLALFSLLGIGLILVNLRIAGNAYWLTLVLVSGISVLLLPLKIIYNPLYGFVFTFPFLVTASLFIHEVYRLIRESAIPFRLLIAGSWVLFAVLLNFPPLLSYYQDGNRPDNRSAFQYVAEHWEDGDRLTGFLMGAAQYYISDKTPRIPLSPENTAEKLQKILDQETGGNGRLWIVLTSSRGGLDRNLRRWLSRHALFETQFTKKRFDYIENNIEVFLVPAKVYKKNKTNDKINSDSLSK